MTEYIHTNLIMENSFIDRIRDRAKMRSGGYVEEDFGGIRVCRLSTEEDTYAEGLLCPRGKHVTVYTPPLYQAEASEQNHISEILAAELCRLLPDMSGKTVMVVGVGNREIASDSIGALVCDKIDVTRHIAVLDKNAFAAMSTCSVCAVSCGTMGQTGISTLELLQGVVQKIMPDAVIAVDALAARESARLGATVQMSDSGISPGAGIGNRQSKIDKSTLGVPVIAIGVPTVIAASTLLADMLGDKISNDELRKITERQKNFFVAPKECDLVSRAAADVISAALNRALLGI